MPQLKLLGAALLERDEASGAGQLTRRHPLALLSLLAGTPSHRLTRSKIAGLLWPESPEDRARSRLNTCVYHTRRAVGDEVLVSSGDELTLRRDRLGCDVWTFREALETLATGAKERGDLGSAARWWQERFHEDPYDGRVAVRLMDVLLAQGKRAAAVVAGQEHVRRARTLSAAGRADEARRTLEEIEQASSPFFEGATLAVLGDVDGALDRFNDANWTPLHSYHLRYDPRSTGRAATLASRSCSGR